jgi:hypothetical protein
MAMALLHAALLLACEPGPNGLLSAPSIEPKGVRAGDKPVVVQFHVEYKSKGLRPKKVTLEQIDTDGDVMKTVGNLHDDGKVPDQIEGDGRYSGVFGVVAPQSGTLLFRATARINGHLAMSKPETLLVTKFPVGLAQSDPKAIVEDTNTGEKLYADEILVGFVEGTSPQRIDEILSAERMNVVGTILELGVYQVRIRGDGTATGVREAVRVIRTHKEVEYAEPNGVTELHDE